MSEPARQWDDLRARGMTAAVLVVVGGGAIWLGGLYLLIVLAASAGIMIWELLRMIAPDEPYVDRVLPVLSGLPIMMMFQDIRFGAFLAVPLILGAVWLAQHKRTFFFYGALVLIGAASLYVVREISGISVLLMIVLVVVVTDIAGYFVGRTVGGPKFWPKISPKKTWSGTIGGWVAAAGVGAFWVESQGLSIIAVCVLLSFASQLGDIIESAIKRRAGVKDCSNLLPGHGGFLDRFDGMIAAFSGWFVIALCSGALKGLF